jgi:phosphoribosylformylglycinamidine synthase
MKNDFRLGGRKISIPPTLLVTAVAVMPDLTKGVSMEFKTAGDLVYVLGWTRNELGGSEYLAELGQLGDRVPQVHIEESVPLYQALAAATSKGLVRSCHDCSDGGMVITLAESAFAGGLGVTVDLKKVPLAENIEREDVILFSESPSRFVVSVSPQHKEEFEQLFTGLPCKCIGTAQAVPQLLIQGRDGQVGIDEAVETLKESWKSTFSGY